MPALPATNELSLTHFNKDITADALLTQRKLADYVVQDRKAHYYFIAKANQHGLLQDLELYFHKRKKPDFVEQTPPDHGRIESREVWTKTGLNAYLDFLHVGQAFVIERQFIDKNRGKLHRETAYGITSRTTDQADA